MPFLTVSQPPTCVKAAVDDDVGRILFVGPGTARTHIDLAGRSSTTSSPAERIHQIRPQHPLASHNHHFIKIQSGQVVENFNAVPDPKLKFSGLRVFGGAGGT
jgi:hypothetical protein